MVLMTNVFRTYLNLRSRGSLEIVEARNDYAEPNPENKPCMVSSGAGSCTQHGVANVQFGIHMRPLFLKGTPSSYEMHCYLL